MLLTPSLSLNVIDLLLTLPEAASSYLHRIRNLLEPVGALAGMGSFN